MQTNQVTRHNTGYDDWLKTANRYLIARLGISIHDLADYRSRDLYEDGVSAEEAALTALEGDDMGALMMDLLDDLYD